MSNDLENRWKVVEKSLNSLREQYDIVHSASRIVMLQPESPLCESIHIVGQQLINVLSILVGDEFESIEWFVNECDFGRKKMEAGCDGEHRIIDSYASLRWLIEVNCAEE